MNILKIEQFKTSPKLVGPTVMFCFSYKLFPLSTLVSLRAQRRFVTTLLELVILYEVLVLGLPMYETLLLIYFST